MTATDELRRLLDERGVEWTAPNSILRDDMTSWEAGGFYYEAFEIPEPDGTFLLTAAHQDDLTPEQAIVATLGDTDATRERQSCVRTCRRLPADNYDEICIVRSYGYEREFGYWKCSECGTNCFEGARYCMNCGAKVVDE